MDGGSVNVDALLAAQASGQPGVSASAPAAPSAAPATAASPAASADPVEQMLAAQASGQPVAHPAATAVSDTAAAPAGESLFQKVNDFGNNLGDSFVHHLGNAVYGASQLVGHGITATADAIYGQPKQSMSGLITGEQPKRTGIVGMIDATNANFDNMLQQREQQYQAAVPTNAASVTGAALGDVLPFAAGGGESSIGGLIGRGADYLTGAASKVSPLLQTILSGGAQGATYGALNPVTSGADTNFAQQKLGQTGMGAVVGGAAPLVAKGAGALYNAARPMVDPMSVVRNNFIPGLAGDNPAALAAKLRTAPTYVPGSIPTTAQAAGTPDLVQAEKALANQSPDFKTAMMLRGNANNAARLSALQQVAGTPDTMNAAMQARRDAIEPFVSQYLTDSRPATRWAGAQTAFQSVLDNPARMPSQDFAAVKQAQQIVGKVRSGDMQEDDALAELKDLHDSVSTQKAQGAFTAAQSAINNNMADPSGVVRTLATIRNGPLGVDPQRAAGLDSLMQSVNGAKNINGLVGLDMLDQVRQQASKMLGSSTPQSALAYGPAKDSIVQAINRVAPGYSDYLGQYAQHSQPITDQRGASGILDHFNNRALNSAQQPALTLGGFNSQLNKAASGPYPMSPQAMDALHGVQNDLQRETVSSSVRSPGSDTAYNLNAPGWLASKLYGGTFQGGGIAPRLVGAGVGSVVPGVGTLGGYLAADSLAKFGAGRVFKAAQNVMMNPQTMADELDKLAAKKPALAKALGRYISQQGAYNAPQIANKTGQ